jgi:hypothetical protein
MHKLAAACCPRCGQCVVADQDPVWAMRSARLCGKPILGLAGGRRKLPRVALIGASATRVILRVARRDAALHDLENHRYPWLQDGVKPIVFGDYSSICQSYLLEHFLADCKNQNVVKSVHLDVGYDPSDPIGETKWLQSLADKHGYPHSIVGYANLAVTNVRDVLEGHLAYGNFRGIRQSLNYHPDPVKTHLDRPGVSRESDRRRGASMAALA